MSSLSLTKGASPVFISTMKNEGPYILEWLAYHRVIGFRDFLIYTNDCDDGTVEILDRLTEMGLVQHERNEVLLRGPHKSALKYAFQHPLADRTWVYVADIDEYLNVKIGDGSVQTLIAKYEDADVIPVTWRLFSHKDMIEYEDVSLMERMTDAERPLTDGGFPDRFVKSLFRRTPDLERFGLHGPRYVDGAGPKWVQPGGRELGQGDNLTRPAEHYGYDVAQVNHYAVRSLDGYLVKKDRGRANHVKQELGGAYWRKMCLGGEQDTSIHRHLEATKAEMARIKSDDVFADLHDDSVAWHKAKIETLQKDRAFRRVRGMIMKMSEAQDHHRRYEKETSNSAESSAAEDPRDRIASLCKELRGLIDHIEPFETAQTAHGELDDLERGLFGVTAR